MNLPPGVGVFDIPGNRPEDEQWELFIEEFYKRFKERYPDSFAKMESLFDDEEEFFDVLADALTIAYEMGESAGFASGKLEAELDRYYEEVEE
jgi:hypothetical protein